MSSRKKKRKTRNANYFIVSYLCGTVLGGAVRILVKGAYKLARNTHPTKITSYSYVWTPDSGMLQSCPCRVHPDRLSRQSMIWIENNFFQERVREASIFYLNYWKHFWTVRMRPAVLYRILGTPTHVTSNHKVTTVTLMPWFSFMNKFCVWYTIAAFSSGIEAVNAQIEKYSRGQSSRLGKWVFVAFWVHCYTHNYVVFLKKTKKKNNVVTVQWHNQINNGAAIRSPVFFLLSRYKFLTILDS